METKEKDLKYYKANAEEDYITTPISVLRYITELEESAQNLVTDEVSSGVSDSHECKFYVNSDWTRLDCECGKSKSPSSD